MEVSLGVHLGDGAEAVAEHGGGAVEAVEPPHPGSAVVPELVRAPPGYAGFLAGLPDRRLVARLAVAFARHRFGRGRGGRRRSLGVRRVFRRAARSARNVATASRGLNTYAAGTSGFRNGRRIACAAARWLRGGRGRGAPSCASRACRPTRRRSCPGRRCAGCGRLAAASRPTPGPGPWRTLAARRRAESWRRGRQGRSSPAPSPAPPTARAAVPRRRAGRGRRRGESTPASRPTGNGA